jgi:hypothetical protein
MIKISKHKTKAGKFVVTIRGRTPDGESFRDRRVAPTSSKSGTERWAQDRERFLLTGGAEKAKTKTKIKEVPTLAEFEPRFIEQYAIANRLKPSTVDTYRTRLRCSSCRRSVPFASTQSTRVRSSGSRPLWRNSTLRR